MKWQYLKSKDIIDIIAPSYGIKREVNKFISKACKAVEMLGFTPRYSEKMIDVKKSIFAANSDQFRYEDFRKALDCEESKAIWALRGGYGANKLLPFLLNDPKPVRAKPLIGFSDITYLINFLYLKWNIPSIHGPVLSHYVNNKSFENLEYVRDLLTGVKNQINYEIFPLNDFARQAHSYEAIIIGGNTMLMQNSLATSYQINTDNKIIFMEEVDERGYALDRVLTHLKDANFFSKAQAIIFGDVIARKERNGKDLCIDAISDFANKMLLPIYRIKNIGHGALNFPLPLGENAKISSKNGQFLLTVDSGGRY